MSNATTKKKSTNKSSTTKGVDGNNDNDTYINVEKNEGDVVDYNDFQDVTPDWAR